MQTLNSKTRVVDAVKQAREQEAKLYLTRQGRWVITKDAKGHDWKPLSFCGAKS